MSARTMQILADLAARRALDGLNRLCEEQKQVSTGRLYAYVTQAGDTLAGYAFELRREHDALAQRCQSLEEAVERMDSCNKAIAADALVACSERDALRAEVDRLRNPSDDMLVAGQEVWARGRIGALEDCEEARAIYMAMIDAAMEAPR